MPRRCSICDHDQRPDIDAALVGGLSNRAIARQFQVGRDSLRRHRKNGHVSEMLAKASEAAEAARGDNLMSRVNDLNERALRILDRAERAGELRTALHAIRELRGIIELLFDTERRRNAETSISTEQLMTLMNAIADIIRRHVPSPEVRTKIAEELRLLSDVEVEDDL